MATDSIYRVALIGYAQYNQQLVNTLYYKATEGTVFDTQAEDLAQAVLADVAPAHETTRSVATALQTISIRGVTDPTEGFDYVIPVPTAGTITGEALPPQASAVITWTTGLVGRRFRGRMFCWPAGEASQVSGNIVTGYYNALDAFGTAIVQIGDGVLTAIYKQVVWSPTFSQATLVTGHVVRSTLHTQRRRVLGTGS